MKMIKKEKKSIFSYEYATTTTNSKNLKKIQNSHKNKRQKNFTMIEIEKIIN